MAETTGDRRRAVVWEYEGIAPVVHPAAYLHETAVLVGNVVVEADCYVGPGAVLRGDLGPILLRQGSNLQDTCVIHSFPEVEAVVGEGASVGHGAILHGCRIGPNALIGMNAVVMDGAVVGENSVVGALTLVKAGMTIPPNSLFVGLPGRLKRGLTDAELRQKREEAGVYLLLAARGRERGRTTFALENIAERGKPSGNRP
ncbi:LbetaH domain-containing protein [Hypericibacter adhaerens]|nr:phenylacetic acid degradation protein PaaY [Hypericibacter adhaerens]